MMFPCIKVHILKTGGNWVQRQAAGVTLPYDARLVSAPESPFAPLLILSMQKFLGADKPALGAEILSHINRIHFIIA